MSPRSSNKLEGVLNFRDVGKTINEFTGEELMAEGMLYRSARLDDATEADRASFDDHMNGTFLRTIIDLRTKSEHVKQAKKREAQKKLAALQPDSNFSDDLEVKSTRVETIQCNINGRGFEKNLLWQLTWWQLIKLLVLMLFGYRMEAISILGTNVMRPRGLIGLGYDTLDYCQEELGNVLRLLCHPSTTPTLIHCTQGKDRTGMVVMLILLRVGIPLNAISYDYTLSEAELLPQREQMLKEIREVGLTDEFAGCPGDWVYKMKAYIDQKYGGISQYMATIGLDENTQLKLVRMFAPGRGLEEGEEVRFRGR